MSSGWLRNVEVNVRVMASNQLNMFIQKAEENKTIRIFFGNVNCKLSNFVHTKRKHFFVRASGH